MPIGLIIFLVHMISMNLALNGMTSAVSGDAANATAVRGAAGPAKGTRTQLDAPPVQVFLYKDTKPDAMTYGYRVVNGSAFQISTLLIGFNHYLDSPELRIAPAGWDGSNVPATSFRSPNGWHFEVTPTEEDSLINLQWQVDSLTTGLLGGGTLAGFEVTVPQADSKYETGHWTVYLNSAQQNYFAGSIDASGTTGAPASSVFGRNEVRVKPNPSRAGVIIEYSAATTGSCSLDILDAAGRSVRRLTASVTRNGRQQVIWDGSDSGGRRTTPGVYFVWVQTPTTQRFARFVLER